MLKSKSSKSIVKKQQVPKLGKQRLNYLPEVTINDQEHILVDGKRWLGYEVTPIFTSSLTNNEFLEELNGIQNLLNSMPFSVFDLYFQKSVSEYNSQTTFLNQKLKNADYFFQESILNETIRKIKEQKIVKRRFYLFCLVDLVTDDEIKIFESIHANLIKRLDFSNFVDVFETHFKTKDIRTATITKERHGNGVKGLSMKIGEHHHKALIIHRFPDTLKHYFWSSIFEISDDFNVVMHFRQSERYDAIKRLDKRYDYSSQMISKKRSEMVKSASEEVNTDMVLTHIQANSEEKLFSFSIVFDFIGNDPKRLEKHEKTLKSLSLGFGFVEISLIPKDGILATLPCVYRSKSVEKLLTMYGYTMPSHTLSRLYPCVTESFTDEKGVYVGKTDENFVFIDRLNRKMYDNSNMLVFGTTGSGKTTMIENDILRNASTGVQTIVITPDRGFRFNENVADVLVFDADHQNSVNPFAVNSLITDIDDYETGTAKSNAYNQKVESVMAFFGQIKDLTASEDKMLEDYVKQAYKQHGFVESSTSIPETVPNLSTFYDLIIENEDLKNFCEELYVYAKGRKANFFGDRKWNFDKKIIVFNLMNILGDDSKSAQKTVELVVMSILINIREHYKTLKTPFSVYVDEFQALMKNRIIMDFFITMARRVRKYGENQGSFIVSTQNATDLKLVPEITSIVNMMTFYVIHSCNSDQIDFLQNEMGLKFTDHHKTFLLSKTKYKYLFFAGKKPIIIDVANDRSHAEQQFIITK